MNEYESNLAALPSGEHYEMEDLLLYALEMLTPAERAAVDAHLGLGKPGLEDRDFEDRSSKEQDLADQAQTSTLDPRGGCPHCRAELAAVQETIGSYAVAMAEAESLATPPSASRERLLEAVGQPGTAGDDLYAARTYAARTSAEPHQPASAPLASISSAAPGRAVAASQPRSRRGATAAAWIGWAVAATMALTATHFYQQSRSLRLGLATQQDQIARLSVERARAREVVSALTDRSAQRVTLTLAKSSAPPQPTGRATYLASKGTLIFLASHLDPLPAGKTYELWVIPASGAAPVAAGTFRPDERGNANVVTARLEGTGAAKALGVTIEASGGSSTPTLPILLAGS